MQTKLQQPYRCLAGLRQRPRPWCISSSLLRPFRGWITSARRSPRAPPFGIAGHMWINCQCTSRKRPWDAIQDGHERRACWTRLLKCITLSCHTSLRTGKTLTGESCAGLLCRWNHTNSSIMVQSEKGNDSICFCLKLRWRTSPLSWTALRVIRNSERQDTCVHDSGFAVLRIMQKRHTNSVRRCDVCDHTCPLVDSGRLAESCSEHRSINPTKYFQKYGKYWSDIDRCLIHSFIHDQGEFVPCYDVPSTATIVPLGHGHFALCTRLAKNIPCCQFAVHSSQHSNGFQLENGTNQREG